MVRDLRAAKAAELERMRIVTSQDSGHSAAAKTSGDSPATAKATESKPADAPQPADTGHKP